MGLYDDFFSFGVDSMFEEGQSFKSIAKYLRSEGLSFSDSRLRIFRDSVAGERAFSLSEFSPDTPISDDYLKPTSDLECGQYGIAVSFSGHYEDTGKEVHGRTFEIVGKLTTMNDFLDNVSESIASRLSENSNITVDTLEVEQGYIGEC